MVVEGKIRSSVWPSELYPEGNENTKGPAPKDTGSGADIIDTRANGLQIQKANSSIEYK